MSMSFSEYERVEALIEAKIAEAIQRERTRLRAIIDACPISRYHDYGDGTTTVDLEGTLGRIAEAVDAPSIDHDERMRQQGKHAMGSYDETQYSTWVEWFKWRNMR